MIPDALLNGGCLCGAVRYRCGAPAHPPAFCHCTSCRRAAGAHAVAWFTVAASSLQFTHGQPAIYRSSPPVQRAFCARCGTQLTYRHQDSPDEVDLTVGSLDEPDRVTPAVHIWMMDAPRWDRPGDALPCYPRSRHPDAA
ncbi:MAG TPA: GFA family protein [Burkholderiaceae bacterium]|jgi:hypothetical protein|nr:GFA family protein [Burkholderiaceae bacterium]